MIEKDILEEIKKYNNGEYYEYIKNTILPEYKEENGHSLDHIYHVLNRAFDLNQSLNLGLDFKKISASVFYHDIGRKIEDEIHEKISAKIFIEDKIMEKYFEKEERDIIKEAIEDHRASLKGEPRNIYGKLLSSADRNISIEQPLKRTYEYRVSKEPHLPLEEKIRESFEVLKKKYGVEGYAQKVYFDNGVYQKYLEDIGTLLEDYDLFHHRYLEVNQINELEYYLKNVNKHLIQYIKANIFPDYSLNDLGHNLDHIKEVIKRSFELKETLKLELEDDLVYTIAACHDLGKYINHEIHEKIAAQMFIENEDFKQFFKEDQRNIIKEAIEDHRSSFESLPRSKYGELISSADRNTKIEITFKRSFHVGKVRMPEATYNEILAFNFKRLGKRYGDENPENMFLIDNKYKYYLKEMRELLKDEKKFNDRYSQVNNIKIEDYTKKLNEF